MNNPDTIPQATLQLDTEPDRRPGLLQKYQDHNAQDAAPQQLARREEPSILAIVSQAMGLPGFNMEMVEKFRQWHLEEQRRLAEQAFNAALAAFQEECPIITKDKHVYFQPDGKKPVDYHHTTFAGMVRTVRPLLAKHGLSYSFKVDQTTDPGKVTVICVLKHSGGHFEEAVMTEAKDAGPGRNNIQALGSTVTYLRRYTLEAITGIATAEDESDDDGRESGRDPAQEPGIIMVDDNTAWQTLKGGLWAEAMSPYKDGKLCNLASEGPQRMRHVWAEFPNHAGLCAYFYDWLGDRLEDNGLAWRDISGWAAGLKKNPRTLAPTCLKSDPGDLMLAVDIMFKYLEKSPAAQ